MKKFILVTLATFFSTNNSIAQRNYAVNQIDPELLKDANAVIREDFTSFEILAKDEAIYHVRKVVTILNANAKQYAQEVLGYSKNLKVNSFKGTSYDVNGKQIKKLKQSEIYDQSSYDGSGSYSDNRIKVADLSYGNYPYTVEWEYELKFNYLFIIPGFVVAGDYLVSVEESKCEFVYPKQLKPRFKTYNIEAQAKTETQSEKELTIWEFKKFAAIKAETFGPDRENIFPRISAAPTIFKFDNYEGDMHDWESFGNWIARLNAGKQNLPQKTIDEVIKITQPLTTTEHKVKALYEYMQSKTRYVSIQFGIGGFQPIDAITVDQAGYGDCKALSNYMVALLKEAGIKANYVLIEAGENQGNLDASFPSSQFNHAVVCVPTVKDTLWLECTSQNNPMGYMGTFTGNRKALAIAENGAFIVSTPSYLENENLQTRTVI
ncbi:MAG: DUF3857 domain-containing transglutaminase family protein [Cyclobacteriaceae bacterium]|nr:DUF3857 domain-containing transglutaminase family protein [Cyclobacteriaceae bacterium]